MYARIGVAVAFLLAPVFACAQPLADRIPADAIIYLGWRGSESMGGDYDRSRLKAVLSESRIPELLEQTLPRLIERVGMQDPRAAEVLRVVASLSKPIWRYPSALYVGPVMDDVGAPPRPRGALMCLAGAEAGALKDQVAKLLDDAGEPNVPVSVFQQGELVVLQVGFHRETEALAGETVPSLLTSPAFKQAMTRVQADPVLVAYADFEAVFAQLDQLVEMGDNAEARENWPRAKEALGLAGLKRFIWTSGFEATEWGSRCFIAAPAPRTGLLSLIESEPLSEDIYRSIPASATMAFAAKIDLSKVLGGILDVVAKVNPRGRREAEQGLAQVTQMLGFDLRKDLLEALGNEWAVYSDPRSSGRGLLGLTLVNRLRNPADAERTLGNLERFSNDMLAQRMREEKATIQIRQQQVGDLTVHYLAVPFVAPAWAIKDGKLYGGLYPQVVVVAAEALGPKEKTILDVPEFLALRKRLGADKASAFAYVNLPETALDSYQLLLMAAQGATGMADVVGAKPPMMLLPPLGRIRPHLIPAASFSWSDNDGWYARSITPFPGAGLLGVPVK